METIDLSKAQMRLLITWLIGSMPAFIYVFVKTLDPEASGIEKVWGWLMPTIMPTLLMVAGTCAGVALAKQTSREVNRLFYQISVCISVFYLLAVFCTVFVSLRSTNAVDDLNKSSIFIGSLQGLASACLGAFFVSKKSQNSVPKPRVGQAAGGK